MKDNFEKAFQFVIEQEGEMSDDPNDPGGLTHWGISHRAHPDLDIESLTLEQAKTIYKREYWDACKCDSLSDGWDIMCFDTAVNCGPSIARKLIEESDVLSEVALNRIAFYAKLPGFGRYGKGWINRTLRCYRRCL